MHIKICGITNLEDALAAAESGADYLGFNFYPQSPRCIREEDCARIVAATRERRLAVTIAGVFVNHSIAEITRITKDCRLDFAQLSGDELLEMQVELAAQNVRAFKAIRQSKERTLLAAYAAMGPREPALLLDASVPNAYGGTGQMADWNWAAKVASAYPIFLAGGLTPENVGEAIQRVRPWGVDTASGVESAPGKKDSEKMRQFCQTAKAAFLANQDRK